MLDATTRAARINLSIIIGLFLAIVAVALLSGCSSDSGTKPGGEQSTATCAGCHQDQELLQATADPDDSEPPEDAGEG